MIGPPRGGGIAVDGQLCVAWVFRKVGSFGVVVLDSDDVYGGGGGGCAIAADVGRGTDAQRTPDLQPTERQPGPHSPARQQDQQQRDEHPRAKDRPSRSRACLVG